MVADRVTLDPFGGSRSSIVPQVLASGDHDEQPMLLNEIQAALADAMIETRYQPVVRLGDRVPVGLEALARMNHPVRGTVLPDEFVPQIEGAGLSPQFTDLVATRAFADMTAPALFQLGLTVSLNVPLDVLLQTSALMRLDEQRRDAGLPVERVVIELTESRPVHDLVALRVSLDHLRNKGYQIVIDDVGPGVPALDEMLNLPFTGMKLDKDLVAQLEHVPEAEAMAKRIIAMGKAHRITVVAEGVADVALWHKMRAMGVDQAQGFLVAQPLPAAAVPVWLKSWQEQPAF